jgi:hypothetical protein
MHKSLLFCACPQNVSPYVELSTVHPPHAAHHSVHAIVPARTTASACRLDFELGKCSKQAMGNKLPTYKPYVEIPSNVVLWMIIER